MKRLLIALLFALPAFGQNVPYSDITLSSRGTPVGGAPIAVCGNPGLATTAAQVTANIAVLTMSSNPITAGFVANQAIAVSGFTVADTYFNGGTVTSTGITNNFLILSVTSTQITYSLVHANASATTNGSVFQAGSQAQACAPLSSISNDAAGASPITQPGLVSTGLGNYQFYAAPNSYYVQFFGATIGELIKPIVLPPSTVNGTTSFTNLTVSGTGTLKNINSVRYADQFSGADCGAKINAADSDLGSTTGEIWVNQNCGLTISTAVNITNAHTLRFIQGGLYTLSANVQVSGTGGGILGPAPTRVTGGGLGLPVVTIKEANAANLASMVSMNAGNTFFQNIALDGNKANQASGGICLLINKAGGVHATGFTVQNCLTDGIQVLSTAGTKNNESDTFKASDFISQTNSGWGLNCIATNDMLIGNEFEVESNAAGGILLNDCSAARITHGEDSVNTGDNLKLIGTLASNGAANNKITNVQFCCSGVGTHDINITGWDSVSSSIQVHSNIFANNTFIGNANITSNTVPSVLFQDTNNNVFTGNMMTSNSGHTWKWLVQSVDVNSSSVGSNVITGNSTFSGSTAGNGAGAPTGGVAALSGDSITGNNFFSTTVAGQNFALANGQCLNIYNNAGTQVCMVQLDTSNNPFIAGNGSLFIRPNGAASSTGQISLSSTNINPSTGGAVALGANGAPWGSLALGTTSNAFIFTPANPAATRTVTIPDPGTNVNLPFVIPATSAAFATATAAGTCVQNTTAVAGAATTMAVSVSPVSTPGVGAVWSAFVSSAGNVTINECAVAASAGGTIAFNIRVTP